MAIAFCGTTGALILSKLIIEYAIDHQPSWNRTTPVLEFFIGRDFVVFTNSLTAAGIVSSLIAYFSASASSRALRRWDIFASAMCAGLLAPVLYMIVTTVLIIKKITTTQPAGIIELLAVLMSNAILFAAVAGCIGWGFASYVPKNPGDTRP